MYKVAQSPIPLRQRLLLFILLRRIDEPLLLQYIQALLHRLLVLRRDPLVLRIIALLRQRMQQNLGRLVARKTIDRVPEQLVQSRRLARLDRVVVQYLIRRDVVGIRLLQQSRSVQFLRLSQNAPILVVHCVQHWTEKKNYLILTIRHLIELAVLRTCLNRVRWLEVLQLYLLLGQQQPRAQQVQ